MRFTTANTRTRAHVRTSTETHKDTRTVWSGTNAKATIEASSCACGQSQCLSSLRPSCCSCGASPPRFHTSTSTGRARTTCCSRRSFAWSGTCGSANRSYSVHFVQERRWRALLVLCGTTSAFVVRATTRRLLSIQCLGDRSGEPLKRATVGGEPPLIGGSPLRLAGS